MVLALGAGQHLLDVIEAADETGAQIEAFGPKLIRAAPRPSERVKTCPSGLYVNVTVPVASVSLSRHQRCWRCKWWRD